MAKKSVRTVLVVPHPKATKEEADEARARLARKCLWELLATAQRQVPPLTWIREGGLEATEFLQCLDDGRWHPLLNAWKERKATTAANRPAPTAREIHARRLVTLMCAALELLGMSKHKAREQSAKALARSKPALLTPSPNTIEHWQRRAGPLTEEDERLLRAAIQGCGKEPAQVASYFVGLIHAYHNPMVTFHLEPGPQDPPDLIA